MKPLIIHCVRAHEEILEVFDKHKPTVPVIFHGYNNKQAIAGRLLSAGYYLSFGAAILNDRWPAAGVLKSANKTQVFFETDTADISIESIYASAAGLTETSMDTLMNQQQTNFKKVFKIK